jgi:hypothetical protein
MNILASWTIIFFINPPWWLTVDFHIFICTSLFRKWLWSLPLPNYLISPWSWSCLSFHFSRAIPPISQKVNCYPWHSICSRSSPTSQRCFNFISNYRTPIEMKPVVLVPKFYKWISIKNLALSSTCSRSYTRNIGAIRNCKLCWPSYLQYSISRAIDLRLR